MTLSKQSFDQEISDYESPKNNYFTTTLGQYVEGRNRVQRVKILHSFSIC